jgi:hypothetical protein
MLEQTTPNTGNGILLILAVWGAIADSRYKARGGKCETVNYRKYFLQSAVVVLIVFSVLGYYGGARMVGELLGSLLVWTFAGYELRRFFVRRANPVLLLKK